MGSPNDIIGVLPIWPDDVNYDLDLGDSGLNRHVVPSIYNKNPTSSPSLSSLVSSSKFSCDRPTMVKVNGIRLERSGRELRALRNDHTRLESNQPIIGLTRAFSTPPIMLCEILALGVTGAKGY